MRTTPLLALALLLPLTALAAPTRDEVERSLMGFEHIPGKQALLRLGSSVDQVLREIALKPSARRMLARTRAITLLRLFPSRETAAALKQVIAETDHRSAVEGTNRAKDGLDQLHLQQALCSYAVVAGPASLALVKAYLSHPSMDVRYSAAEAVRLSRSTQATAVLQSREPLEKAPMVRHQIRRQLELLRRGPARLVDGSP
jgi:hypothetical protein